MGTAVDTVPHPSPAAAAVTPAAPAATTGAEPAGPVGSAGSRGTGRYVVAQVAGAFGQTAGVSAGLLAVHLTGATAVGVVPAGLLALGGAAAGPTLAWVMGRRGRSAGLLAGYLAAVAGVIASLVAAASGSLGLLLAATVLFGSGNSAVMLTRYVLADAVPADQRGRAISRSLLATTAGAVVGPNLLGPAGHLATALDLPDAAGLYLLAVVAFALAAAVLHLGPSPGTGTGPQPRSSPERPDPGRSPDDLGGGSAPVGGTDHGGPRPGGSEGGRSRRDGTERGGTDHGGGSGRLALVVLSVANASMVSVMALAGVHLHEHGHGLGAIGTTVSLHIAGMFVGSPVVGRLCDRVGARTVALAGAVLLTIVGAAGMVVAGGGIVAMSVLLLALGIAWNLQVVAGSVLLTAGVLPERRPAAEGRGEMAMGLAAGLGTLLGASSLTALGGFRLVSAAAAVAGVGLASRLSTAASGNGPGGGPDQAAEATGAATTGASA
jgi:MFS family permease